MPIALRAAETGLLHAPEQRSGRDKPVKLVPRYPK
jgi:hypothetical protein